MKSTLMRVVVALMLGVGGVVVSAPASYAVATCLGQPATWEGTAGDDTTTGTSGDDVFVGLDGNDTVDGLGGDDLFCLGDGTDVATGGGGTNHFVDGPGADTYWGNPTGNADVIDFSEIPGGVNLRLQGYPSPDAVHDIHTVIGSPSDDDLYGDAWPNLILGGGGSDTIEGLGGDDEIHGGPGLDWVSGWTGDDVLTGDEGRDRVFDGPGDDTLIGASAVGESTGEDNLDFRFSETPVQVSLIDGSATGDGSDTISGFTSVWGSDHDDVLVGDDLPNQLFGEGGDDVLDGAGDDDLLDGGDGSDTASFATSPNGVTTVHLENVVGDGTDTLWSCSAVSGSPFNDTLTWPGIVFTGMAGNDSFIGNQWSGLFDGGSGDDTFLLRDGGQYQVTGGDGIDTVTYEQFGQGIQVDLSTGQGSAGGSITSFLDVPEVLTGSPYDDSLTGSTAAETINGLGGNDTIRGLGGDDHLGGGADDDLVRPAEGSDDQILAGDGTDTVTYENFGTGVDVDLSNGQGTAPGTSTIFLDVPEVLTGSPFGDDLTGSSGGDTINGLGGNDVITPGDGDDHANGGPGVDTLDYAAATQGIVADLAAGKSAGQGLDTMSGVENVNGSSYADSLLGNGLANAFRGRAGNDRMTGLGGPDRYDGGPGIDWVSFGSAGHFVYANLAEGKASGEGADSLFEVERLIGSRFSDTLIGNAVANLFRGGPGADRLDGRSGDDSLFGNTGRDQLAGGLGTDACFGGPDIDRASTCETRRSIP